MQQTDPSCCARSNTVRSNETKTAVRELQRFLYNLLVPTKEADLSQLPNQRGYSNFIHVTGLWGIFYARGKGASGSSLNFPGRKHELMSEQKTLILAQKKILNIA